MHAELVVTGLVTAKADASRNPMAGGPGGGRRF